MNDTTTIAMVIAISMLYVALLFGFEQEESKEKVFIDCGGYESLNMEVSDKVI